MEDNKQVEVNEELKEDTDTATVQKAEEPQEKSFTQEDVNNIAARESKKATEKLLKDLGIEDFEDAKDGLKKFKEWQETQKTEEEKKADLLKSLQAENEDYKNKIGSLEAKLEATTLGVAKEAIDDVITLASKDVTEDVTIGEAIKNLLEKYPHFKEEKKEETKKPTIVNPKNNTGNDNLKEDTVDKLLKKYNYK